MSAPRMQRADAIALVRRLMTGDYADDAEAGAILDALERGLACPHVGELIFYPKQERPATAQDIVEQALAYQPIAL
jgi:Colicin immunity protein / pyocin immunity protein